MTQKIMKHKPRHAAYKRPHKYEFQLQNEWGWDGQKGQHPASREEANDRPRKERIESDDLAGRGIIL
jgi:hypothetical protein